MEGVRSMFETLGLPTLMDYVKIPCVSPLYDPQWERNGHIETAITVIKDWTESLGIEGLRSEVLRVEGAPPALVCDVEGTGGSEATVVIYGHLDKQPGQDSWDAFTPVLREGRLYGRGSSDDGYAVISSLLAVKSLGSPRPHCVLLMEFEEESGSPHFPLYLRQLSLTPTLVIVLDSNVPNFDRIWVTDSMRGSINFDLTVEVLQKGVHSGCSGLIPDSFRVLRSLIGRIEDHQTGSIRLPELHTNIPVKVYSQYAELSAMDPHWLSSFPLDSDTHPLHTDTVELRLNQTWRPALTITGVSGLPSCSKAGNVLRPSTSVRMAIRLPPDIHPETAFFHVEKTLCTNVPSDTKFTIDRVKMASGWVANTRSSRLDNALTEASNLCFGVDYGCSAAGGTIPVLSLLSSAFPEAEFLVTGVLSPDSNAHSPNESLNIEYCVRLTAALERVIGAFI